MRAARPGRPRSAPAACLGALVCLLALACGRYTPTAVSTPTAGAASVPPPPPSSAQRLLDWPQFGLDPQRSDVSALASGITAANLPRLRRMTVALPGTVDSSPVYLHGALVGGAAHNVVLVTTTYGRTLTLDADSGRILWTFTPPGYERLKGSAQITTASPLLDPDRRFVYAASPDGLIHKLSLFDGREAAGNWPAHITRSPAREKVGSALNIDGPDLLASTGGYFGDAPAYQGHLVLIDRSSGQLRGVFNTLCAHRRGLIDPASCAASGAAIWARSGAVVEPGGGRILVSTGNGPWNGGTNFGDSVLELTFPALALRQAYTPTNQAALSANDTDLGSSAPALLGGDRVAQTGKDGIVRVLALSRLNGRRPAGGTPRLGGELQRLSTPGAEALMSSPAVWSTARGAHTTMFVATASGTAAYVRKGGRLYLAWRNENPGTSPVMAGGLLYVYDPSGGGIYVYRPNSPRPLAKLGGAPGHWNSPIVVDGHVVEPEGDANEHRLTGTLDLFWTGER